MDPYYRRQRRRRLIWRGFVIAAFFGVLSLPLLYLLRGEIRQVAAAGYKTAAQRLAGIDASPTATTPVLQTPTPSAPSTDAPPGLIPAQVETPKPAPVQAQAPRSPAPSGPPPKSASIGTNKFRIPAGYIESNDDLRQKNQLVLHGLLPRLGPRADGTGDCAPKKVMCPDYAVVRINGWAGPIDREISKRYRGQPSQLGLMPAQHGLRQVPPRRSGELGGRHFLAEAEGRTVWIRCRDLSTPAQLAAGSGPKVKKPRTARPGKQRTGTKPTATKQADTRQGRGQPAANPAIANQAVSGQAAPGQASPTAATKGRKSGHMAGICTLTFETPDGLNIATRFRSEKLGDWAAIQARAAELVARIRA